MTSRLNLAITGSLTRYLKADAKAMAKIHTQTMRAAGARTRKGIRAQITSAFGGSAQFAKAIRLVSDPPRGNANDTSVRVFSKARYKKQGIRQAPIDLLEVWSRSETIRAAGSAWLAVPTPNAPMRGGAGVGRGGAQRLASPRESGLKLVFIQMKDPNKAVLVYQHPNLARPVIMYVLVKQTSRTARLDPDAVHLRSVARVPKDVARFWAREDEKIKAQFGRGLDLGQD